MNPLKIGNVTCVSSGQMEVMLTVRDLDVEHNGKAYRIGQIGSYVTVPMNERTLVGFVNSSDSSSWDRSRRLDANWYWFKMKQDG